MPSWRVPRDSFTHILIPYLFSSPLAALSRAAHIVHMASSAKEAEEEQTEEENAFHTDPPAKCEHKRLIGQCKVCCKSQRSRVASVKEAEEEQTEEENELHTDPPAKCEHKRLFWQCKVCCQK